MAIDVEAVGMQMFEAAFAVVKDKAPSTGNYVKGECLKLAQTLATIEAEETAGELSTEQAALLLDMQKTTMRSVLTATEGLGLLDAEAAINAALAVVRQTVDVALGAVRL
jgi:hypothetical protein